MTFEGRHYRATAMGMEPKPPQGRRLPIWIGGASTAALRRVGRLGDGWLASRVTDAEDGFRAYGYWGAAVARRLPAVWLRRFIIGVGGLLTLYYFGKTL